MKRCDNCEYWKRHYVGKYSRFKVSADNWPGECWFNPPQLIARTSHRDAEGHMKHKLETLWPETKGGQWCGSFSKAEGTVATVIAAAA
ncbi:hypothetical protein [Azonexus hydrophilus]|uniref:Uncharacterized protein n=1 Tax=Azonexus hydrophilus TaxID=418702 RepID=A0ABZ2XLH3_9RHOO